MALEAELHAAVDGLRTAVDRAQVAKLRLEQPIARIAAAVAALPPGLLDPAVANRTVSDARRVLDPHLLNNTATALAEWLALQQQPTASSSNSSDEVRRTSGELLYRYDDRTHGELTDGVFAARGGAATLEQYVLSNSPSEFVGTTSIADPKEVGFLRGKKYQYVLIGPGGIDVNRSLPNNPYAEEHEIAFRERSPRIVAVRELFRDGGRGPATVLNDLNQDDR